MDRTTNILITFIGTVLLVVFWIIKFISPQKSKYNLSIPFIFFFNLISISSNIFLPIIFYLITNIFSNIFVKLFILIIEIFSVNFFFGVCNKILVKKLETDISIKFKNRIYLLSTCYSFLFLFLFLIKTVVRYKNTNFADIDDFFAYLIAPLSIIVGNIFPLKCSYSTGKIFKEISCNWQSEYSLKNEDKEIIFYTKGISHITNLFFCSFFIIEKIEYGIDHLYGPVLVAVVLSGVMMYVLHLIDKKK